MASTYTNVVYIQGNSRRRYRGYVSATVSNISATQSRVNWYASVEMYSAAQYGVAVTCTVDGTQRGSDEGYLSSSPGTTYKTVASTSGSTTFSRGSSSRSVSVAVRAYGKTVSGYGSAGGSASASVSVTIPSIAYSAPNAPSSCAASRVSDTQAKVTWANGSTSTTAPRSATLVERQTDALPWSQVASVGASVTSYTDNSVSANHRYAYRVRAKGAGGTSGYSTSGYVYTTPAAPASVSVAVVTGTTCSVDVDGSNAPWAQSWEVQSQLNGGEWQAVGSFKTFPQTVDLGGGTVRLRARSLRGSLASAWTESGTITTICPPLAPTVSLDPSGVVPTGAAVAVSWVPSHPDGSDQTQAQVEVTVGDGSPTTADVTGASTAYQLPAGATESPATVSVRVRTHGADEQWGAWSGLVSVTVAEPPSVYFSAPPVDGAAVGALPLTVEWDVTDSTGVASQSVALLDASGRTLYSAEPAPSARDLVLGDSTYRLSNTTEYALRITVRGGSSLTATAERSFRTSFAEPARPVVQAETDPSDMSVAVSVHAGAESSASGEVIDVPATPGTLVPGLTVYGATRQNLWVNPATRTVNGVTLTANADGSITLSGTATADTLIFTTVYNLKQSTRYTLSVDKAVQNGSEAVAGFYVEEFGSADSNTSHVIANGQSSVSFTTKDDVKKASYAFLAFTGAVLTGTYRVMLNEGSEPEPWCPPGLNGVDELSIVTAGKNLVQVNSGLHVINGVTFTIYSNGSTRISGTATARANYRDAVIDLPAGDYVLSGAKSGKCNVFLSYTGDDGTTKYVDGYGSPDGIVNFTLHSKKTVGITYDVRTAGAVDTTLYPQIELGSTATAYEPPAVTITPIDLDGHTLNSLPDGTRDELRVDGTGAVTLVQRVAVQTIEPEDWEIVETNNYWLADADSEFPNVFGPLLSDKYVSVDTATLLPYSQRLAYSNFRILNGGEAGAQESESTRPKSQTVLYPLATPQEVELPGVSMPSFPADPSTLFAASDVPCAVQVDYPATSSLTVQRVAPDGSIWTVAGGLLSGQQAIDPLPPLNVPVDYVVTAHTAAGATSEVRVTETLRALVGAFNFGQAAGECVLARLDPDWSHDVARSGTLYHFADGGEGGGLPVAYGGQDVDATRSMGFTLLDTGQLRRLQALAREYFVCWYRDPYGGRSLCAVDWSFSSGIPYDRLDVSASMTETVFEEAW